MSWPKSSFGFFHKMLQESPGELFGQPNTKGDQCTQFSSVQSLSRVWLFPTPWTTACQASLSITNSWSLPKFMSIESVMPSNRLILCRPLLLLPSAFPNIRVFMVHVLLKPGLDNFEYYFTSVWDDWNCMVFWAFFAKSIFVSTCIQIWHYDIFLLEFGPA